MQAQGGSEVGKPPLCIALLPAQVQLGLLRTTGRGTPPGLYLYCEEVRAADGDPVQACGAALKRALQRLGDVPRAAAMALPDSQAAERCLELPAGLSEAQYETALRAEAEGLLPYPAAELLIDYRLSSPGAGARTAHLAVCRRTVCEPLQAIAGLAGLQLQRIGIAGQARRQGRELLQHGRVQLQVGTAPAPQAVLELCCGLGLGAGFNFLPWRRQKRRGLHRRLALGLVLSAAALQLPVVLGSWHLHQRQENLQAQLADREQQHRQLRLQGTELQQRKAHYAQLQTHSATMRNWSTGNRQLLRLLSELPGLLPEGVRLKRLALHGEQLQLWGEAGGAGQVTRLLQRMRTAGLREAQLNTIRAERIAPGHHFSLRARLWKREVP